MKDLNFFEAYVEKRQLKLSVPMILVTVIGLYLVYTLVFGLINHNQIKSLERGISDLRAIAENPRTLERVNEIKELETDLMTFEEEVNKIKEMDKVVETSDIIGEDYLDEIISKMPEDLYFTNLSINNREIQISGTSQDKWAVAEFAKGLEAIDNVDEIFVSNITGEEDTYRFSMTLILKEVYIYDENIV